MSDPMDDFDTGIDTGMPAAIVVMIWLAGLSCIGAMLIAVAVIVTMMGVGK